MRVPPDLQLERILDVLRRHDVAFVLIGGTATVYHGSPFLTYDVDITPQRERANLDRLSAALTELDAKVRTSSEDEGLPFSHSGESLDAAGVWNLTTPFGDLDISFVPNGTSGYDDLNSDAEAATIDGVEVRVASLADIIRSKQAANRPKDQRVLPTLREILASRNPRNQQSRIGQD
jgi:predicted nucleotidyltransferase